MSLQPHETRVFLETNMEQATSEPFLTGVAALFTMRSPDKDSVNEDGLALIPFDAESGILVVTDGVGGYRLGDQASASTIHALQESLAAGAREGAQLRTAILNGIEKANDAILKLGVGAATTLAIASIRGTSARSYHIGDSMVCVVGQRGRLKLQTVSHSPVGFAVEAGILDEKEAIHHEDRHLVSNVIGTPSMRIEIGSRVHLALRDTVLLGSDGLFDNMHMSEILDVIRKGPLEEGVQKLATTCRNRMQAPNGDEPSKPDDLTIVAYRRRPVT